MRLEPFFYWGQEVVFCDDCPGLAAGRYDGAPLCIDCLRRAIEDNVSSPPLTPLFSRDDLLPVVCRGRVDTYRNVA